MPGKEKPFHALLKEHLEQGTRAAQAAADPSRRPWKHEDFAGQAGFGPRTLTNWNNGSRTPEQAQFDSIAGLLFGDNPMHVAARAELLRAWTMADQQRGLPGRRGQSASGQPEVRRPGGQKATDWVPQPPFVREPGLARLYVHQSDNEPVGDAVALTVTAETGRVYVPIDKTEDTPRVDTTFAVARAEIVVVHDLNVTPKPGTELGTARNPHPNVSFATSWTVTVPLATDGVPGGVVLAGETLRQYTARDGLPYGIRIELRCNDTDLKPVDQTVLPTVSEKQRAILRRFLQGELAHNETGIITLARAELCGRIDP